MKSFKRSLFLLIIPLFAFTTMHKFYMSVTNVSYSEKYSSLQITSRIFIDDLETLLKTRYDIEANLATEDELEIAAIYLQKYFRQKFVIEINGKQMEYQFLGKKYDTDLAIFYLEVPDIDLSKVKSVAVQNKVLTDLYDEQQNLLHIKLNGSKKSFVLLKNNDKGMLKL
ncbi:hypothetical protein GH721_08040 [Kriegella sp. EG-1]|nr:hypothetical protein [Flavobacteriaceae bacterium EG-1]